MEKLDTIAGIFVTMQVDRVQVLYVALFADGTLWRMGTGSESNNEWGLFVGKSSPDLFELLRDQITPDLLRLVGVHADPFPKGKPCELTIGFRLGDGEEMLSQWEYGSLSQGPSLEIRHFVTTVIETTNVWYEQQKRLKCRSQPSPPIFSYRGGTPAE